MYLVIVIRRQTHIGCMVSAESTLIRTGSDSARATDAVVMIFWLLGSDFVIPVIPPFSVSSHLIESGISIFFMVSNVSNSFQTFLKPQHLSGVTNIIEIMAGAIDNVCHE